MRILVFQHIECEHPGMLRTCLSEHDVEWDAVELDQGEAIPELNDYDALGVMGGQPPSLFPPVVTPLSRTKAVCVCVMRAKLVSTEMNARSLL